MEEWQTKISSQIGGCTELIKHIVTQISLAEQVPSLRCSKGILLHGKPGIGKTALALTVASKNETDKQNKGFVLTCSY
ncbi:hypothetical protein BD560DRAFT_398655, partial [Blakeslea trispora]